MAAVRTNQVTHHFPRADGTYRVYVETRRTPVKKYRLKLSLEELAEACDKLVAGASSEDVAAEYQIPLTTFTKLTYPVLLARAREGLRRGVTTVEYIQA